MSPDTRSPANDAHYLQLALQQARLAAQAGEVPVGAVVVSPNGQVLGAGYNRTIADHDPSAHAEIQALRSAAQASANHRLEGCTLYVTLEPCVMCAGAIYWGNVRHVVYGISEKRLLELTGDNEQNPTFSLPCRQVFASGQKDITVEGPFPEIEAEVVRVHEGYWD